MTTSFPDRTPSGSSSGEPSRDAYDSGRLIDDATRFSSSDEELGGDEHDFELAEESDQQDNSGSGPIGVLGEYLLLEQIGSGGMGQVYRAEHRTMNRQVALKVLNQSIAVRHDLLEQFYSEIRAVAKLMHPNIVTAFDAGSVDNIHYLVMELVVGESISQRIARLGALKTSEVVHVLEQAARALAYAHQAGIVHRDIKPSNMMLTGDGTLKILDFGLAMLGQKIESERKSNMFLGTPEYMSPEQIENPDQADRRSDLYSLGATLFYMLAGKPMFTGEKMQVAMAQLRQKPMALYLARPEADLRLDAVFQRLVAKKPSDRFASAKDLLLALKEHNLIATPAVASPIQIGSGRMDAEQATSVATSKSTLTRKLQAIGIDLGMMVSTAAFCDPVTGPQVVPQGEGNGNYLRNMLWSAGEQIRVGAEAMELRQSHPEHVFHSVQRWIGVPRIQRSFGGQIAPPEVVLACLLRHMLLNAASMTDGGTHAVVTVPSCYDQLHRRAIRNACSIAGIDLLQLLDKPLAAVLCWLDIQSRLHANPVGSFDSPACSRAIAGPQDRGSDQADTQPGCDAATSDTKHILVVHLGGTGLEASLIRTEGMQAQQLGVSGNLKLGSLRWQSVLTEYFASEAREKTGKSIRDDVSAATRLQRTIELALDRLTRSTKVEVRFDWLGISIKKTVTQEMLVQLGGQLRSAIGVCVKAACETAGVSPREIDQVLLLGGMLRIESLWKAVLESLPHSPPMQHMEKADVARGAALQARQLATLTSNENAGLPHAVSCTAYELALLACDSIRGSLKPRSIVDKGSKLPVHVNKTLRTSLSDSGKPAVIESLQIIESTSLGEQTWHQLGKVHPTEVFSNRPEQDLLQLKLEVDESGILETDLCWPAGNRQLRFPSGTDNTLSAAEVERWRGWLETMLLCSD